MKKLLIICVALISLILVAAAVAPKEFKIEKSITINKPTAEVFAYLKMMDNNNYWQPWSKMDPDMQSELKGVDGTVGAIVTWSGNSEVGVGEQEIVAISENEKIDFELRFTKPMQTTKAASIATESIGEAETKVTWTMVGETKFPFNLVCFFMHGKVEKNFEQGLNELKAILEKSSITEEKILAEEVDAKKEESAEAPNAEVNAEKSEVKTEEVKK